MTKKWIGVLGVAFAMCLAISFAPAAHAQDNGKVQVFAGYSFTTNSIDNSNSIDADGATTGLHGYTASAVWNFSNNIGFEANFDGHNGTPVVYQCSGDCDGGGETDKLRQDLYTYTFGPKFTATMGNWSIWGHALAGGTHFHEGASYCYTDDTPNCEPYEGGTAAGNGFALKTGGGLDWNHGMWGVRLVEIDYVHISGLANVHYDDNDYTEKYNATANNIEVSAGIIFNLGRK